MKGRLVTYPLLCAMLLLLGGGHSTIRAQDKMTFKSFATAEGKALDIDLSAREILWRFDSNIEMRFPFEKINFILFGTDRFARVRAGADSLLHEGTISEFSPDRGLRLRPKGRSALTFILTDLKSIDIPDSTTIR